MKIAKVLQALTLGLALFAAASCQNAPIHTVENHPVPAAAQKLSLAEMEQAIIQAGSSRGWRFERLGQGSLRATQRHPNGYDAVVDVTFNQTAYNIRLNSTTGLRQRDGTIHPHYNLWVRNLEKDIEDRLHAAGIARP
jgi:hypothetical protein